MKKNKSLQKNLTINLILVIAAFYFIAGSISFYFAYREAEEFQDDVLKQIARYSGDNSSVPTSATLKLSDEEYAVFVFHLPNDTLPKWLQTPLHLGFQEISSPHGKMRVFVNDDDQGRDIVAQLTEARDELAANSALRSLIPLLFLLPMIAFLIDRLVRNEFRIINARAAELDQQTSANLKEISIEELPSEITPFFAATNRLIERIKSLLNFKRRFIADASHELRTPITALALQVDNLEAARDLNEIRSRLVPLKESVKRTIALANQLLTYSKYEVHRANLTQVNLTTTVTHILSDLYTLAAEKKMNFEVQIQENLEPLLTDEQILKTLLGNIIHNSIKFSPKDSTITLKVRIVDRWIEILLMDGGPGIPEKERKTVFDPFTRLVESNIEGSGLGLAIAKECVELLNGKIYLRSREDGKSGLVVVLHIPKI